MKGTFTNGPSSQTQQDRALLYVLLAAKIKPGDAAPIIAKYRQMKGRV